MQKYYNISFSGDRDYEEDWVALNNQKIYMDYEENLIENYNFQGFADQLFAISYGWA